jgi:hypothetical protein
MAIVIHLLSGDSPRDWDILRNMVASRAFLLLAALCVGLAVFFVAGCGDHQESFYPSLADADKAEAISHGWIPDDLLPASSRAIHSVVEVSPSREWCAFEFLTADSQNLRKNLKPVGVLPASVKHIPNPGASWWPALLRGNLDARKIRTAGLELYVVERPGTSVSKEVFVFAIDWAKGRGFFYLTSAPGPTP